MSEQPIKLIVGLGNPGSQYEKTRHNAGAWFVQALASEHQLTLRNEKKFHCTIARLTAFDHDCWLMQPTGYMNESGLALSKVARFYKLNPANILVAHDELDFPPGKVRLKYGGGHGGHNGLRDIMQRLGNGDFCRLRIGIGHPGHRDQVTPYVLSTPAKQDKQTITASIQASLAILPNLIHGDAQKAMRLLHNEV